MKFSNQLSEALDQSAKLVDSRLNELLNQKITAESLLSAVRYSSIGCGKKLRPFLLLAALRDLGIKTEIGLDYAVAIEMIHSYSLIHDDLPAMDDDDFRRGKPSCHKKFNEATAILAGDALLTLAFQVLASANRGQNEIKADNNPNEAIQKLKIIELTAKYAGINGMVGGQALDLEWSGPNKTENYLFEANKNKLLQLHEFDEMRIIKLLDIENKQKNHEIAEIMQIHFLKTGKLFALTCEIAAILSNQTELTRVKLRNFGHYFGFAFQLLDDFDDFEKKSDEDSELNLVRKIGRKPSLELFQKFKNLANSQLEGVVGDSSLLSSLINWINVA